MSHFVVDLIAYSYHALAEWLAKAGSNPPKRHLQIMSGLVYAFGPLVIVGLALIANFYITHHR